MSHTDPNYSIEEHSLFVSERDKLIDAARESARTFDQTVLAFGSAMFGGSVVFLKDVAPHPAGFTLKWLGLAWGLMATGLLSILFSFLFSHKACMKEIDCGEAKLNDPESKRPKNHWSTATTVCNYSCVFLLFIGLVCWSVFAFENLAHTEGTMNKPNTGQVDRAYTPPPPPPRVPPPPTKSTPPPPPPQK